MSKHARFAVLSTLAAGLSLSAMHRKGFCLNTPAIGEYADAYNPALFANSPTAILWQDDPTTAAQFTAAPAPAAPAANPAAPAPAAPAANPAAPAAPAGQPAAMDIAAMRQRFTQLHTEAMQFVESSRGRDRTTEEQQAQDARFAEATRLQTAINDQTRFAGLGLAQALTMQAQSPTNPTQGGGMADPPATIYTPHGTVQFAGNPQGQNQLAISQEDARLFTVNVGLSDTQRQRRLQLHQMAVARYIRTGRDDLAAQFTLTTATGGGVLLPVSVGEPRVIKRMPNVLRQVLASRGITPIRTTSTENFNYPIFDDTGNTADEIAQNATGDNPKDPSVSGLALGAKVYDSGTVWIANLSLRALDFDLVNRIQPMIDARLDNKQAVTWMTTLRTTATVGKQGATTNGVTYPELLDWQHSIPVPYRGTGVFVISDGFFRACRGLVDTTGNPIFQESLRDDAPDRLLGWPLFVTDQLPTPAANAITGIALAAEMLMIRDIVGSTRIVRYVDQPNWPDQTGLRGFTYGDFNFQPTAVRSFKQSA